MPRVLILDSTHPDLIVTKPYTMIVRNHGFIFKKLDYQDEDNLEYVFMIKIEPEQMKRIEIQAGYCNGGGMGKAMGRPDS